MVDEFTEWHLRLLKFFQDPNGFARRHNIVLPSLMAGSPGDMLEAAYPDLRGKRNFYSQLWQELFRRGLVNTDGLGTLMSGDGTKAKRTNEYGDEFLRFIEDPLAQGSNG